MDFINGELIIPDPRHHKIYFRKLDTHNLYIKDKLQKISFRKQSTQTKPNNDGYAFQQNQTILIFRFSDTKILDLKKDSIFVLHF